MVSYFHVRSTAPIRFLFLTELNVPIGNTTVQTLPRLHIGLCLAWQGINVCVLNKLDSVSLHTPYALSAQFFSSISLSLSLSLSVSFFFRE